MSVRKSTRAHVHTEHGTVLMLGAIKEKCICCKAGGVARGTAVSQPVAAVSLRAKKLRGATPTSADKTKRLLATFASTQTSIRASRPSQFQQRSKQEALLAGYPFLRGKTTLIERRAYTEHRAAQVSDTALERDEVQCTYQQPTACCV
jgi:hypothetical protein